MRIQVQCECGKVLVANDTLAGQTIQCNLCRREVFVPDPRAAPPPEPEPETAAAGETPPSNRHPQEYLYWLLPLAFLPLAINLGKPPDNLEIRFNRALSRQTEDVQQRIEERLEDPNATLSEIVNLFPGGKLDDTAFLPRKSWLHWVYAAAAAGAFLVLVMLFFTPGTAEGWHLLLVGLFTATVGIGLLLIVHDFGLFGLLIHYSVVAGEDPTQSFLTSWIGFTFGVGLVEEAVKLVPLLWLFNKRGRLSWRGACLWGLASGIGFGVNEGVIYSEEFYNGITTGEIYVVRFVSCVALHAIWTASAGISLYHNQDFLRHVHNYYEYGVVVVKAAAVVIVLHGLYDVLLTRQMNFPALMVGAASFAWLAWQIERTRSKEPAAATAATAAA